MQVNRQLSTVPAFLMILIPAVIIGMCRPRCSPIRTNDQWDRARCIWRAKDIWTIPYRKGTAYPLIAIPQNAVIAKDNRSKTLMSVVTIR